MSKVYAGIGSRALNREEVGFCRYVGWWLAKKGWDLKTGAAKGADQGFANGAISCQTPDKGEVELCLPWPSYEKKWVDKACLDGAHSKVLQFFHKDAWESVEKHHPTHWLLPNGAKSLHARNYLIIENVKFVLAWPKGPHGGGTAQGIRVAKALDIDVIDLSTEEGFERVNRVLR